MKNIWYRSGNYYQENYGKIDSLVKQSVVFYSSGKTAIIRQFSIFHYATGNTVIYLKPSPFFNEELRVACQKFFKGNLHFLLNYNLALISSSQSLSIEQVLENEPITEPILIYRQGIKHFLYISKNGKWKYIDKLNSSELLQLNFGERKPEILSSEQVPAALYEEITLKKGYDSIDNGIAEIIIKLDSFKALQCLFTVLHHFNTTRETIYFPTEIIQELTNIFDFHKKSKRKIYRHNLPTTILNAAYINPERKESRNLLKELYKYKDFSLQEIIKGLRMGEDPNQCDNTSVVAHAILSFPVILLKWLMVYGGDVFHPAYRDDLSPLEYALKYDRKEHLNLISLTLSALKKSPRESKLSINKIEFSADSDHVNTFIEFNNIKTLKTSLKKSTQLSEWEEKELYKMFAEHFNAFSSEENIKTIFQEDILENKLLELIFDLEFPKKLIGFAVYELFMEEDILTIHIVFVALLNEYRGYAIISLLSLGFVFSTSLIAENFIVDSIFIAIDYNSYRLVENFLHSPMHAYFDRKLIKKKLVRIFGEKDLRYFENGIMNYIEDNIMVRSNPEFSSVNDQNSEQNIRKSFFNEEILGLKKEVKETKPLGNQKLPGGSIFFQATYRNFLQLCEVIKLTLGVDLNLHIPLYAYALQPMLCKLLNIPKIKIEKLSFYDSESLFFNNKKYRIVIKNIDENLYSSVRRSRL